MPQDAATERETALQARIAQLAERHGQAAIARKTGTSRQNVSRYLKGRRVPLEFASALVEGLGVNPAWLVAGEGSPYLADVNASTAESASDMIEMVRAMEAVSRRRLGELAGKDYANTLRDLNDSLQSFERVRERLNDQTRPWLKRLIDEMEEATGTGQLAHARSLNQACAQLGRFCTDRELQDAHQDVQAYLQHRLGNVEASLALSQELFLRRLAINPGTPLWCRAAHNLVVGMMGPGRLGEARRLCNAALAIMADGVAETDHYHRQLALAGLLDVDLGDVRMGLPRLATAAAYVNRQRYSVARGLFEFAQLVSGATDLERCLRGYVAGELIHRRLLAFACWLEEPELLKRAYKLVTQRRDEPDEGKDPVIDQARRMLSAMESEKVQAAEPVADRFKNCISAINQAQLYRLAGERKAAASVSLEAAKACDALPGHLTLPLTTRATHARNCLESAPKQPGKRWAAALTGARAFFDHYFESGYGCFSEWATAASDSRTAG